MKKLKINNLEHIIGGNCFLIGMAWAALATMPFATMLVDDAATECWNS